MFSTFGRVIRQQEGGINDPPREFSPLLFNPCVTSRVMLKGRSTGEILVLLIAVTICTVVIGAMLIIGTLEIMDATTDTSSAVNVLSDVLNTLIGLMAGFLAGSTNRKQKDELAD